MIKEPILAKILKYLMYATALVPLVIFSQFMSPFHFGKVIVFRSLIEIVLVFYILLVWQDRTYLPKMNKIFGAFILFTVAFTITTATSIATYSSFWGSIERMGGLWTFWHYLLFFVILISVLRTKKEWLLFAEIMVFSGILSAFYGFGQKTDIGFFIGSGNRARIFGTIGNPALFAGYQLLTLFLSLTLFFKIGNSVGKKIFFGSAAAIMSLAVLMTAVRGSILALGVGFLIFAFLYAWNYKTQIAKKILMSLLIGAVLFVVFSLTMKNTAFVTNSSYLTRVTNISFSNFTVQTRFWAWQAGLKGWSESPRTVLLGWGPENFNIPFSKNFNPKFFTGPGSETLFDRAHNMFVEILVTMGLLGFLTYVGLFTIIFSCLKKIKQSPENMIYGLGFIPLVVAYMIHNAFIFDTSANFITFFSILGFISFLSDSNGDKKNVVEPARHYNKTIQGVVAVILIIVVSVLIYRTNILPSKANYTTTRAIILGWSGNFNATVAKYQEAMSYDVPGKYEIRNRFGQYMLEQSQKSVNLDANNHFKPEFVEATKIVITEIQKNADENPYDYLPHLYIARMYIILGKDDPKSPYNDEALAHALKALELSPTFVRTNYEIAQAYLNKKDKVKAAEYFKRASELNPEVGLSLWYWGIIEFDLGNEDLGTELISKALATDFQGSESDYLKMITVFYKRGDYNKLVLLYQKIIALSPNNPQYHASIAVAYAKLNKIDEAVQEARIAAKLSPTFEAEARRFVQSLGREF